jgi:hypothetical protein
MEALGRVHQHRPSCLDMPSTPREGEAWRRGVGCSAISFDSPAAPSALGEGAGSMAVGLTPLEGLTPLDGLTPLVGLTPLQMQ